MVSIITSNGLVNIPTEIIKKSETLSLMLQDIDIEIDSIPIDKITSLSLQRIIDYYLYHIENPNLYKNHQNDEEHKIFDPFVCDWDQNFFDKLSSDDVLLIINDSDFLGMKEIYDCSCKILAQYLRIYAEDEVKLAEILHINLEEAKRQQAEQDALEEAEEKALDEKSEESEESEESEKSIKSDESNELD